MAHRVGHDPRREEPRLIEDEGDPQRGLVGEDPVRRLAVLPERLPVVRREHHERAAGLPRGQDRLQEGAERGVGRGHLAVVGVPAEARGEGLGRVIGVVRLVEVHPAEEGPPARRLEPPARERHRVGAPSLLELESRPGEGPDEAVVVDLEAAPQAEPRREREAR